MYGLHCFLGNSMGEFTEKNANIIIVLHVLSKMFSDLLQKKKELLKSGNDSEKPYKLVIGVCTVQVTISYIL